MDGYPPVIVTFVRDQLKGYDVSDAEFRHFCAAVFAATLDHGKDPALAWARAITDWRIRMEGDRDATLP